MNTLHRFDWEHGATKARILHRSFASLDAAERFAKGKDVKDIYKSAGKFRVEWIKTTREDG